MSSDIEQARAIGVAPATNLVGKEVVLAERTVEIYTLVRTALELDEVWTPYRGKHTMNLFVLAANGNWDSSALASDTELLIYYQAPVGEHVAKLDPISPESAQAVHLLDAEWTATDELRYAMKRVDDTKVYCGIALKCNVEVPEQNSTMDQMLWWIQNVAYPITLTVTDQFVANTPDLWAYRYW